MPYVLLFRIDFNIPWMQFCTMMTTIAVYSISVILPSPSPFFFFFVHLSLYPNLMNLYDVFNKIVILQMISTSNGFKLPSFIVIMPWFWLLISLRDLICGKTETALKGLHRPRWIFVRPTWIFLPLPIVVENYLQLRCTWRTF